MKRARLLLVLAIAPACSDPEVRQGRDEIIGGFPARSPRLNAIGAIGFAIPDDTGDGATHQPFCSATLIAPDAVLTAEHCVEFLVGDEEFLIGFDATRPQRTVKITGVISEQTIGGGFVGLGSDIAVAFLAEQIDDIAPLPTGVLTDGDVGTQYVGIGYGIRSNAGEAGQRFLGAMELRGIGGNHALNVWGSFETYLEHFAELDVDDIDPQALFDALALLDDYEATFGAAPGNAQACFGDSGGPIARSVAGQLTVFGVTSGGLGTTSLICDWGGVYAVLGPAALDLIDRAFGCGPVPIEGTCDGNVAVRCALPDEGGYEPVRTDCSLVGLMCALDETGSIGCMDDPCEGLPEGGRCDGDVFIRCSLPDAGPRHVVEQDCAASGGTCGVDGDIVGCIGLTGSCEGNCGGASTDPDGNVLCFCDDLCTDVGDCCDDFEQVCPLPDPEPVTPADGRAQRLR